MTTLTLWAPGRPSPTPFLDQSAPKKGIDRSVLKKKFSQSQLPQEGSTLLEALSTPEFIEADIPQAWAQALQEIEAAGICGLDLETTGLDPLSSRSEERRVGKECRL